MHTRVWALLLAVGSASCTTQPPDVPKRENEAPLAEPAGVTAPKPGGPRYVLRPKRPEVPQLPGLIAEGVRFAMEDGELQRATETTNPPLRGYFEIPRHRGGGFFFHNGLRLFRASGFTSDLQEFAELGSDVYGVEFGPGFLLVSTATGYVALDEKDGARRALPLPGLASVGTDAEGNSLGLTVTGDALLSVKGGRWTRVNDQLPSTALDVQRIEETVSFVLASGVNVSIDATGRWIELPPRQSVSAEPPWQGNDAALTVAVEKGVALPGNRAAVALGSVVAVVDLGSGQPVSASPTLVPGANDCTLLPAEPEPLLACFGGNGLTIVSTPISAPVVERTFPTPSQTSYAVGVLVVDQSCEGKQLAGLACVRDATGAYTDVDVQEVLRQAFELTPETVGTVNLFWYASAEGAFAFVNSPSPAFLNVRSRTVVLAPETHWDELRRVMPYHRSGDVLTSVLATPSEGIQLRGYGSVGGFAINIGGRVESPPQQLHAVVPAGARALGVVDNQVFESLDFGKTWTEIQAAPGGPSVFRCSDVGCSGNQWLRLGWGPQPPLTKPRETAVLAPSSVRVRKLPQLTCREVSAPEVKTASPSVETNGITRDLGFGARMVTMSTGENTFFRQLGRWRWQSYEDGLLAFVHGRVPAVTTDSDGNMILTRGELGRAKSIFFARPFDPKGEVRTANVTWRAQHDVLRRLGGEVSAPSPYDQSDLLVLPVLEEDGLVDGVLLVDELNSPVWVHDSGAVEPLGLGPDAGSLEVLAAASVRGELRLLLRYGGNQNRIVRAGRTTLEVTAAPPGELRGLAVSGDGQVSAVYGPVGADPPSTEDPVFVRGEGGISTMPSWTTLRAATAPECAKSAGDARALFRVDESWIALDLPALTPNAYQSGTPMMALVRFDEQRLCLEAVELGTSAYVNQLNLGMRVVARFDAERGGAGKVGIDLGTEYRQALSCTLQH
jgi:hypothetical protein